MLIFLDIETTGLESVDRICSIGIIGSDSVDMISLYELVYEGKKISSKASSINHITNEMIKDKSKFKDTKAYHFLQKYNNEESTIVAHNIKFNLEMLLASEFQWYGKIIDTQRVTKHLIPECEEFSLQFLRYELKLYKDENQEISKYLENIQPQIYMHNALNDALVVKLLYIYLLDMKSHSELIDLSFKNVLIEKFEFGKYKGRYIEEVAMSDRSYLEWILCDTSKLYEDLKYTIQNYINYSEGSIKFI